ncbi:MAG TPA: hypothetical protein PLU64_04815, partial [Saprospiraceae bacterium]|nr:hypothetical protein [Saprospiraceae bacterium]
RAEAALAGEGLYRRRRPGWEGLPGRECSEWAGGRACKPLISEADFKVKPVYMPAGQSLGVWGALLRSFNLTRILPTALKTASDHLRQRTRANDINIDNSEKMGEVNRIGECCCWDRSRNKFIPHLLEA